MSADEPGKRNITIDQLQLLPSHMGIEHIFIDSNNTTVKEDGYLVVCVSGMQTRGKVLILVLSEEIKV